MSDLDDIEYTVNPISDINDSTEKLHTSDESKNKEQRQSTRSSEFFSNFVKRNKILEKSKSKILDSPPK